MSTYQEQKDAWDRQVKQSPEGFEPYVSNAEIKSLILELLAATESSSKSQTD